MIKNILSIDVEEVFHAEYARKYKKQLLDYRTPHFIPVVLRLLGERGVRATFFVVGEIAEKFPEVIDAIIEQGHEVAFHGQKHLPLWEITSKFFQEEIRIFKKLCPSCKGYRAPSFSLCNKTKWALWILQKSGFHYDSSIFPAWTPLYGLFNAPTRPYRPSLADLSREDGDGTIMEFPLAVYNALGLKIPIAGGFWFRLWNLSLIMKGIRKMNKKKIPAVMFLHSWELDQHTIRLDLPLVNRLVTYHGISDLKRKFSALISSFRFTDFESFLEEES